MSELETIAELSVALAGFAGIVYVFSDADSRSDIRAWRIRNLLLIALSTMFTSIATIGLPAIGISDGDVSRIGSVLLGASLLSISIVAFPGFFKLDVGSRSRLGGRFFYVVTPIMMSIMLVQFLNAAGTFGSKTYGVLYYGLLLTLMAGSAQFMVSILDSDEGGA